MKRSAFRTVWIIAAAVIGLLGRPAAAVYPGTQDPFTGYWEGMTWDYVGQKITIPGGNHSGHSSYVAISERYLLTANHVAIDSSEHLEVNGIWYDIEDIVTKDELFGEGAPDLKLIKVTRHTPVATEQIIPEYYRVYTEAVLEDSLGILVGYGPSGVKKWGTNEMSIRDDDVVFSYDPGATDYESKGESGDSGGGMFLKDSDGAWKLVSPIDWVGGGVYLLPRIDRIRDVMLTGDLDGDGVVRVSDIDYYDDNVDTGDPDTYDFNRDGTVDNDDRNYLIDFLAEWERTAEAGHGSKVGDFNLDGAVNGTDLAIMQTYFGQSVDSYAKADANGDGVVNGTDLAILQTSFGFAAANDTGAVLENHWAHDPGTSGDWSDGASDWSRGAEPTENHTVFIGNGGTVTVTEADEVAKRMAVGSEESGSDGTLLISGSGELTTDVLHIGGQAGTGLTRQTGGTVTVNDALYLGLYEDSVGTYELVDGYLTATAELIGLAGTGDFVQTGGTNTVVGTLHVRNDNGYRLQGGLLDVNELFIGGPWIEGWYSIEASMTQSGGMFEADTIAINMDCSFDQTGGMASCPTVAVLQGGTYHISGSAQMAATGTMTVTNGTVEWFTDGLTANSLVLTTGGASVGIPYLLMGFNFQVDELVDGTLSGGSISGLDQTLAIMTQGAVATHDSGSAEFKVLAVSTPVSDSGRYDLVGTGALTVEDLVVAPNGTLNLGSSAVLTVSNMAGFHPLSTFTAEPNSEMHLIVDANGGYGFRIQNTSAAAMAGLEDLTLIVEGDSTEDIYTLLELAGSDQGENQAGFENNFAFGGLYLSASGGGDPFLKLVDQLYTLADAALYVYDLDLDAGTTLHLNGYNIYCQTFTDLGATIYYTGVGGTGNIYEMGSGGAGAPEPATLFILSVGALAVLRRPRRWTVHDNNVRG
ncbi:MAG: dockerin type I domain-containing protein [Planctomycetota bacterium]|jgi:hypothetical protein